MALEVDIPVDQLSPINLIKVVARNEKLAFDAAENKMFNVCVL
jgi:hypothetical protein